MSIGEDVTTSGRVNIRIHSEDGPPNNPSGKQDEVWGEVDMKTIFSGFTMILLFYTDSRTL
jgi:hypothetical protein